MTAQLAPQLGLHSSPCGSKRSPCSGRLVLIAMAGRASADRARCPRPIRIRFRWLLSYHHGGVHSPLLRITMTPYGLGAVTALCFALSSEISLLQFGRHGAFRFGVVVKNTGARSLNEIGERDFRNLPDPERGFVSAPAAHQQLTRCDRQDRAMRT